jgi:arylsulfatase A-like enzyme
VLLGNVFGFAAELRDMSDSEGRPNVVLVTTDQHRASALGCADDEPVETPNLDRLAGEGTRFERAYANTPLCAPSRASLLTGRYPGRAGVRDNGDRLADDATTLGEAFSTAGYRTGYVGKWHLSGDEENYGGTDGSVAEQIQSRGFDRTVVPEAAHAYFDVDHFVDGDERVETEGYAPAVQTEYALEFLRGSADDPTCLVLSYGPPHNPYEQVPGRFRERYDVEEIPLRPNVEPILSYGDDHPEPVPLWAPPSSVGSVDLAVSDKTYTDPREGLRDYYAQITAVDRQIGRLLDGLEDLGMADDTLVVYTSDHGDQLWSQGHSQKGVPYEESIHVPLLVRWPGEVSAGRETKSMASLVDLVPTLCELADVDGPPDAAGEDLSTLVRGETDDGRDAVPLANYAVGWRGVRTDRYTYAKTSSEALPHLPNGGWLLFDDDWDPYQLENRLYDPAYRDAREECERLVEEFVERTDDPFPADD